MAMLLTFLFLVPPLTISTDFSLNIDVKTIISSKPTPFYGFTIDWWTSDDPTYGKKWGNAGALTIDFSNDDFVSLTKAVSPAFLRIGGSPEDSIIYNISGECLDVNASLPGYSCSQTHNNYGCMNVSRWQQINEFAIKTNTTLLFGLNGCYGRPSKDKSMNFSNIRTLFDATVNTIDSHSNLYGFELANELNDHIDADIYAKDFIQVHKMMKDAFAQQKFKPYLVGADVGSTSYSQQFIDALQKQTNTINVSNILHSLTYHHYPNCNYPGKGVVYDLSCLESIHSSAIQYSDIAKGGFTMSWMGEGSEHSGGGVTNVSDTFVDTFYYLYQLCSVLAWQVPGTMRSDLVGGDYQLIDKDTFLPNPSYWILYMMKMFVGESMFTAFGQGNLRAFAFNGVGEGGKEQIVLALINFDLAEEATVTINIENGASEYDSEEYHLKQDGHDLNSKTMMVNGVKMEYVNGKFPEIVPVKGDGKTVTMKSATSAFVVFSPTASL